jgi:hypothetical protein
MEISKSFAWSISIIWLLCLFLSICIELTPLEFTPLAIGNPIHWGVGGFAFPVSGLLRVQFQQLRRVWILIPKLLWGGMISIQVLWMFALLLYWDKHQPLWYFWRDAPVPLEYVFARREYWWRTEDADFRHGNSRVIRQLLIHPRYGVTNTRRAIITRVATGLQWTEPIAYDSILAKTWLSIDISKMHQ